MSTSKEETRVRLFEAARKLLIKGGFHHVKLEDIAEAAGVSRQAVYKSHFASKSELLLELVRYVHVAENLDELTRSYFAAQSGRDMLREAIRSLVLIEARVHDIAMALSAAALSDAGALAALQDRLMVKRGALRDAIARVEAEGELDPDFEPEEAVDLLDALLSIDTYQKLVSDRGWEPERLIRRVWEFAERLLLRAPAPRKRSRARV